MGDSIYSELMSLYTVLAVDVMSPSGLADNMGVVDGPYVGRERFELFLPLLMAAGVAVSEAEVLVSAWSTWPAPEQAGKEGHPALSVRMKGENSGLSGLNTTWWVTFQNIRSASVVSAIRFNFVVSLGEIGAHSLPPGGIVWVGLLLQH